MNDTTLEKIKYWTKKLLLLVFPFIIISYDFKKNGKSIKYSVITCLIGIVIFLNFWSAIFSKESEMDEYKSKVDEYENANSEFATQVQDLEKDNEKLRIDLKEAQEIETPIATEISTPIETPIPTPTPIKTPEQPKEYVLGNGNFVAGKDFPAGTYDISVVSGNGNVSSDNMWSGGINAIMGVGNDDMYQKEYKNIKLPKGTTLKISNVKIKLTKVK